MQVQKKKLAEFQKELSPGGAIQQQSQPMHSHTPPESLTPDVDVPVRTPRTGVSTAPGVRGLGLEEVVVLEVRTGVAIRARGAGGGRLQADKLAAPVKDEGATGENGRMTPNATGL